MIVKRVPSFFLILAFRLVITQIGKQEGFDTSKDSPFEAQFKDKDAADLLPKKVEDDVAIDHIDLISNSDQAGDPVVLQQRLGRRSGYPKVEARSPD